MPHVKNMFFVRSEVILYLCIWYFLCTFLQLNRRFTFNWTAMFEVTLSQRITHATLLTTCTGAVPVSIPPPQIHSIPPSYDILTSRGILQCYTMWCGQWVSTFQKHIYPVFSAIKCLMMEATASHTYQTTRRLFQITPFIYTVSLQLGPPVDHTNPRKLTIAHLVLPVQHRHYTLPPPDTQPSLARS